VRGEAETAGGNAAARIPVGADGEAGAGGYS